MTSSSNADPLTGFTDPPYVLRVDVEGTQTPIPAALPLFATGLGVIGLLARRKKRKAAAVLAAA